MEKTFVKGKVNECCELDENLEKQPSNKPEMIIEKCRVCNRNHYTLKLGEILASR